MKEIFKLFIKIYFTKILAFEAIKAYRAYFSIRGMKSIDIYNQIHGYHNLAEVGNLIME